jgi:hypothetical protein
VVADRDAARVSLEDVAERGPTPRGGSIVAVDKLAVVGRGSSLTGAGAAACYRRSPPGAGPGR